ncbi:hypothetical protein CASFOL_037763 [Castilleja foliolosa]|uniref:DCD domain-containing protein n=1 Tax=Castilleja foliolosa TaxID=1961234 RepID=A0ABD3BJI4_9LAMI
MAPCRGLGKSQLGGVIFGCTNRTMEECLTNQLFGLPGQHILYVKNIEPGLPLFLFNYSDRKLHGIYEAVGSGAMNINLYAWTAGGSGITKFPAQVQIRDRLKCQPLSENQFKPIIADNYFEPKHFYFELDRAQASKLISMLSSAAAAPAVGPSMFTPQNPQKWAVVTKTPLLDDQRDKSVSSEPCLDEDDDQSKELSPFNQTYEKMQYDEKDLMNLKLKKRALSHEFSDAYIKGDVGEAFSADNADVEREKHIDAMMNYQTTISQLSGEVKELKAFKQHQALKVENLEAKLVIFNLHEAFCTSFEAERKIYQLESRCTILESLSNPPTTLSRNEALILSGEIQSNLNESIFIVGGYDGVSWSSALHSFSPSSDVLKSCKSMFVDRAHASVARLDGQLYVFGGGTDIGWYDTVESYNAIDDQWTLCPSLNSKKGCSAAAALNGKLYTIGGGNGVDRFSEVEMFDPNVGRWVYARPMLQKRFALSAVECCGSLYAVGGYNGDEYLNSAERYDPRESSWTRISSMNTKRCGHSTIVLNGKLYAIGGYDGEKMVPIVEIYEPRVGTWMVGEPMNQGRGFLAAALVKDAIYAIGGFKNCSDIVEMVECYKEGQGWQATNLKSVGKKCYASAIVLGDD